VSVPQSTGLQRLQPLQSRSSSSYGLLQPVCGPPLAVPIRVASNDVHTALA
jgi:hypothetical protein